MTEKKDIEKQIIELAKKLDQKTLAIWALDCAEHVIIFFENEYPNDNRPRKAIEAGRNWVRGKMKVGEVRKAALLAHAAARDAKIKTAIAAARSTGHAAATAHVIGHAVHAASYAAKATETVEERDWQYHLLIDLSKSY